MKTEASPLEKLRGVADIEALADVSLVRANGNASRNTYLTLDAGWTRAQAAGLRERANDRLLYGLPIALKDCFDLEGFVTSCGSRFYARHHAAAVEDSWVAERLKTAGAVITGKTHMQMLAYGITGENRDYGDCVQPADATSLTGGSSSGSAAAVQEGSAVAAIGTDTGGSIRAPAALCGLAGYRASLGAGNWRGGAHLAESFDTIGWLCKDLRDLPRLARALFDLPSSEAAAKPARVGYLADGLLEDCDVSVLTSLETWQERLLRAGAQMVSLSPDFCTDAFAIYAPLQAVEAARWHAGFFDEFEPAIAERLRWGASLQQAEIAEWQARHRAFVRDTDALFSGVDFILMPAVPLARLVAGADQATARPRILRYTTPASLAGLPAVVLPGKPVGLQLLAARGADSRLLQFAAEMGDILAAEDVS